MASGQSSLRLWWVATYHDGTVVDERDAPGEISSEQIDRAGLKRFALVDADGGEVFGLDFPEGPDPKLVYRRRSYVGRPIVASEDHPEWLVWPWTYIVGQHFSSGTLDLWSLDPETGEFAPDPDADVELVPCEDFA